VAQENSEILAKATKWQEALNAGDIDALVAMYSADARLMPPNAEASQGPDAIRGAFGGMIAAGLAVKLDTIEAASAGNTGYRVGTYTLTAPGGATADYGKYIELWEKADGGWVITDDIWNSDIPVGAGVTTLAAFHMVEDGARWLAAWQGENSRRDQFAQHGVANVRVFQSPEDPNLTGVLIDVADMDEFQAYLGGEEGVAAKAEDGVKDATLRMLAEVK
jgi:ketosteroid isomerase-like protein